MLQKSDIDQALRRKKIKPRGHTASVSDSLWDAAKELTYYSPTKRNTDLRTGPVPMKDIPTAAGRVARVVKKNIAGPVMDAYQTMSKVNQGKPYSMSEATNFAMTGLLASMAGGPEGGFNPNETAVIRQPPLVTKAIRKILKEEYAARGPETGTMTDKLYRRTLFRGEKHGRWPEVDETGVAVPNFGHKNRTSSNFGEPLGVSASLSPGVAEKFSAHAISRSDAEISRAIPLYGASPDDVMINSMAPAGQELLRESYVHAVNATLDKNPELGLTVLGSDKPWQPFAEGIDTDEFNAIQTDYLVSKGKKGILYHPDRYSEHEIKMFDTKDLLHLDMRNLSDVNEATKRYDYFTRTKSDKAYRQYKQSDMDKGSSLGNLAYSDIPFEDIVTNHPKVKEMLSTIPDKVHTIIQDAGLPPKDVGAAYAFAKKVQTEGIGHAITSNVRYLYETSSGARTVSKIVKNLGSGVVNDWTAKVLGDRRLFSNMLSNDDPGTSIIRALDPKTSDAHADLQGCMAYYSYNKPIVPKEVKDIFASKLRKSLENSEYGYPLHFNHIPVTEDNASTVANLFIRADQDYSHLKLTPEEVKVLSTSSTVQSDLSHPSYELARIGWEYGNTVGSIPPGTEYKDLLNSPHMISTVYFRGTGKRNARLGINPYYEMYARQEFNSADKLTNWMNNKVFYFNRLLAYKDSMLFNNVLSSNTQLPKPFTSIVLARLKDAAPTELSRALGEAVEGVLSTKEMKELIGNILEGKQFSSELAKKVGDNANAFDPGIVRITEQPGVQDRIKAKFNSHASVNTHFPDAKPVSDKFFNFGSNDDTVKLSNIVKWANLDPKKQTVGSAQEAMLMAELKSLSDDSYSLLADLGYNSFIASKLPSIVPVDKAIPLIDFN